MYFAGYFFRAVLSTGGRIQIHEWANLRFLDYGWLPASNVKGAALLPRSRECCLWRRRFHVGDERHTASAKRGESYS